MEGRKVIVFHWQLDLGGAERQSFHLARHLQEHCGANVEVWGAYKNGDQLTRAYDAAKVRWRIVPLAWPATRRGRLKNLLRTARLLRRARPDVLLPYTDAPNVLCGNVWRWSAAKVCLWNQRALPEMPRTRLVLRALHNVSAVLTNATHAQEALVADYGLDPRRVRLIANGVTLNEAQLSRGEWRARLGLAPEAFVAVMVGHLGARKDHVTLLKSWRHVLDLLPPNSLQPVLLLAGEFQDAAAAAQAAAVELRLGSSVRFLGPIEDVSGLLGAADVLAFSTNVEGCPNGVLEAMAAGLAVVATDDPGVRQAVGPEGAEWLAPAKDAARLGQLLLTALQNPEMRARHGAANQRRSQREFSVAATCLKMLEAIEDAWQEAIPARARLAAAR